MMRTYFTTNIPDAVIEAARIDGAGEIRILYRIVLPMAMPILATIGLLVGCPLPAKIDRKKDEKTE